MNADLLARFCEASGHRVILTESGYWYDASPRLYQSLPSTQLRRPSAAELRILFREPRIAGVQFPSLRPAGMATGRFVVRDKDYGLSSLQRQFRQHVRKGLQRCQVREIGFEQLQREGMPVNRDAMTRRPYKMPCFVDPGRWRRFCEAGQTTPGAGVIASFAEEQLAAYLVYFIAGDTAYGMHFLSRSDRRPQRPNHCVYYEFTRRMMSRENVRTVSTGLQSIPVAREIDHFKRHAGYRLEVCHLSVVLRPVVRLILQNRAADLALATLDSLSPGRHSLERYRLVQRMAALTESGLSSLARG